MRTRALLSFAVIAILAIAPGPVSAQGAKIGGLPGTSTLIQVITTIPSQGSGPPRVSHGRAAVPVRLAAPRTVAHGVTTIPDAITPAADLVRTTTVDYARPGTAPAAEPGRGCPAANTCGMYQLGDFLRKADKNGQIVIRYSFNPSGKRVLNAPDDDTVRATLLSAMAEWHHWDSRIVFKDVGDSTAKFGALGADGGCSDGVNVITWDRFDRDILGAAATCVDQTTHTLRDSDLALNVFQRWTDGIDERRPSYDLQSIFTHELGHWIGLMHPDPILGARQSMFASSGTNETFKRTLALGDIKGVQTAYPCGKGDSCPRTGIVND